MKNCYNGYEEMHLSGTQLKELFKSSFYCTGRHHETMISLPIPTFLKTLNIKDVENYRWIYRLNIIPNRALSIKGSNSGADVPPKSGNFKQKTLKIALFLYLFRLSVSKIGVKIKAFAVSNYCQKSSFLFSFNKYSSDKSV